MLPSYLYSTQALPVHEDEEDSKAADVSAR